MKDEIIGLLKNKYDAIKMEDIATSLGINSLEGYTKLKETLFDMVENLDIYRTNKDKYILYDNCSNFRIGVIDVKDKGYGFLDAKNMKNPEKHAEEPSIHIAYDQLNYALDGDTVLVEILGSRKGSKIEGKVLQVKKRGIKNIVGVITNVGGTYVFNPIEKTPIKLNIDPKEFKGCVDGELLAVTLDDDLGKNNYTAHVAAHLGHKDAPGADIKIIAAQHDVFEEFPEDVMEQARALPTEVLPADFEGRKDIRDEVIFTIDGKDTKDVDDSIGIKKVGDLYNLKVSIADVGYYVPEGSPLDKEALKRATSVYLGYSVFPMLPHILSNGICSLNEGVDRCAITCDMMINGKGKVVSSDIYPSIIHSSKKMTYDAVNQIIEKDTIPEGYEPFADDLKLMNELHKLIRKERQDRGSIEFDTVEPKLEFDDKGVCIGCHPDIRGEGQKLIEDFMIAANESVASTLAFFVDGGIPAIYRDHETPSPDRLQSFLTFCEANGYHINGKFNGEISPKDFQKILEQIEAPEEKLIPIHELAIRSQAKAYYSTINTGHFALASKYYCHFTSPIRRYPDTTINRVLHRTIFSNDFSDKTLTYFNDTLPAQAKISSDREVNSDSCEREVDKMFMAQYMESCIGREFDGIITGITSYGMYIRTNDYIEGLMSFDTMDEPFEFNEIAMMAVGQKTKKIYRLGDPIHFFCTGASKIESTIDFGLHKQSLLDDEKKFNNNKIVKDKVRKRSW